MATARERDGGVRALERGLRVLTEVSGASGVTAGEVARRVSLPRPTVYRLLGTLEEQGFVCRSASDDRFRVTAHARNLGAGYEGGSALFQVAGPMLVALGRQLVWPVDLATCNAGEMVVQETTHARSPLSFDHGMIGMRLPLLHTASGRAYLAHCLPEERHALLDYLRRLDQPTDRPMLSPRLVEELVRQVNFDGYAMRGNTGLPIPGTSATKTRSIAVPIGSGAALHGCLAVIWFANAVTFPDAIRDFLPAMLNTASSIAGALGASHGVRGVSTPRTDRESPL